MKVLKFGGVLALLAWAIVMVSRDDSSSSRSQQTTSAAKTMRVTSAIDARKVPLVHGTVGHFSVDLPYTNERDRQGALLSFEAFRRGRTTSVWSYMPADASRGHFCEKPNDCGYTNWYAVTVLPSAKARLRDCPDEVWQPVVMAGYPALRYSCQDSIQLLLPTGERTYRLYAPVGSSPQSGALAERVFESLRPSSA